MTHKMSRTYLVKDNTDPVMHTTFTPFGPVQDSDAQRALYVSVADSLEQRQLDLETFTANHGHFPAGHARLHVMRDLELSWVVRENRYAFRQSDLAQVLYLA